MSLRTLTRTCCIPPPHAGGIGEAADGELGPVRIPPARGGYRPTRCPGELAE